MSRNSMVIWIASPSYLLRQFFLQLFRQKSSRYELHESDTDRIPWNEIMLADTTLLIIDDGYLSDFERVSGVLPDYSSLSDLRVCLLVKNRYSVGPAPTFKHVISIYDSPEEIWSEIESASSQYLKESAEPLTEELSEREKEVLVQIVRGFTNKEIGERLHLSVHTVISHRKNITRKLDIKSTSGLTVYAIMNKLVTMEELNKL